MWLNALFPKAEHPLEVAIAQGGKPYLAKEPDIHFNLSHSGEWAVCAISSSPVGVDIQHCDEGRRDVASRFFHREEIRYLDSLPQFRRDEGFYRLWTLKESFVKATGRGLDLPLRSFWVDIRRGRPQIDCGNIEGQYKLFELDFPADKAYQACRSRQGSERERAASDDTVRAQKIKASTDLLCALPFMRLFVRYAVAPPQRGRHRMRGRLIGSRFNERGKLLYSGLDLPAAPDVHRRKSRLGELTELIKIHADERNILGHAHA